MGITRQIGQHRLRSAERPLCVDNPLGLAQRGQEGCEGLSIGEMNMVAEEAEAADRVGCDELLQEQSPEQAGEHADGQEESRPTGHPALAVGRDATARHDHVYVGVMGHSRAPGVQH